MQNVPLYLDNNFNDKNYLLIYPHLQEEQVVQIQKYKRGYNNPDDFAEIGNFLGSIFK